MLDRLSDRNLTRPDPLKSEYYRKRYQAFLETRLAMAGAWGLLNDRTQTSAH